MKTLLKWALAILGVTTLVCLNYLIGYNLLTSLRAFFITGSLGDAGWAISAMFFAAMVALLDKKAYKLIF